MLEWLEAIGIKAVLNWILEKLVGLFNSIKKDKENHEAQVDQAAQDVQKAKDLKPESTDKDVDDAIDSELGHF